MSRKRFHWVCAGSVLFLFLLLALMQLRVPNPGVTVANFRRLHKGMTEKEVEAIMGGPGKFGGAVTFRHCTVWEELDCTVGIWFSDLSISGVEIGAEKGNMSTNDGLDLLLQDEPATVGFRNWVKMTARQIGMKLRGSGR